MRIRNLALPLFGLSLLPMVSGWNCGGDNACVAAKKHMCENIPSMNCYAAFMDNAQQKIVSACGQAELNAYIPVLQNACNAAQASNTAMNCDALAGKSYAASSDGGSTCTNDGGAPMTFTYSGIATADGRAATLQFTVSGGSVTGGLLHADPVCTTSAHLNRTDVSFTGTLSGSWESATGSISATWTGGDYACDGTQLTAAAGYPTSGSLTISMSGSYVMLQRIISAAEPYQFTASGKVYTPATVVSCATTTSVVDSGSKADALGPVCTQLAACCLTITDNAALKSQCQQSVSNGLGDSGCSIALLDLQNVGYCTGTGGSGGTTSTGGTLGAGGTTGKGGTVGAGGSLDASATGTGGASDANKPSDVSLVGSDAKDASAGTSTANLIVNGDAESAVGSTDGSAVTTPGWTITGNATAIKYDVSGYVASTDPGPTNRGLNYFAGGSSDALSTMTQTISLASYATKVATGAITYTLSGYLGGFSSQDDNVTVTASFRNAAGTEVGTVTIGPVLAADRGSVTGMLAESASGTVPATAQSVFITVTMTRVSGTNNDGYADNLSLVLGGV